MITSTRVEDVFLAALEKGTPEERAAYLRDACRDSPELFRRVERLLEAHPKAKGFLEHLAPSPDVTSELPISESRGSVIGPYKLLEQIGEGGMGVVFMAEQTRPVQRRVALKIIKAGMDTRDVVARFEAERQALAMMDHPNIARVLDAGATDTGRPYFVMELVRGVPMTEFCNQKNLSIRERLELFVTVCQAVQHAHQKAIIHRDIKPTNVLVTLHDGRPVIKVIDFGVAKATGQKLTDKTLFTGFTQMIGTPLYMSPEQAEMTSQDIDTRSDIFSAGVLLYELLTGTTPFDSERLKSASFDELRRIIREEEPPRPSTRLTTLALEAASTVGTQRKSDPRQLTRLFRSELDWIVMKCLEKDRTRRYETASALAGDVERYLHDEPVQACPPSARYRFGKFARRNKTALITVAAVIVAIVLGSVVSIWQAIRAYDAEAQAKTSERQSKAALEFMVNAFRSTDQSRDGRSITIVEVLARSTKELKDKFADDPLAKAKLLFAFGYAYQGLGLTREAIPLYEQSRDLFIANVGREHADTLAVLHKLANTYRLVNRFAEALALDEETLRIRKATLGPDDRDTIGSMNYVSLDYGRLGRLDEARRLDEEVFKLSKAKLGPDDRDTIVYMRNVANDYIESGRRDVGLAMLELSIKIQKAHPGASDGELLLSMEALSDFYRLGGRLSEAIPIMEETVKLGKAKLGPEHPGTLGYMIRLGSAYTQVGRVNEAISILEEALKLCKAKLGPDHITTLQSMDDLATAYQAVGRTDEAIRVNEETLKLRKAILGPDHPDLLESMDILANAYRSAGRIDEALRLHEEALKTMKAKLGPEDPNTLMAMSNLANDYADAGRFQDALKLDEEAFKLWKAKRGPEDRVVLISMGNLANRYSMVGRSEEALGLYEETLKLQKAKLGPDHSDTLQSMGNLALEYQTSGRFEEALRLCEETFKLSNAKLGPEDPFTLWTMSSLAEIYGNCGRHDEAIAMAEEAVKHQKAKMGPEHQDTLNYMNSLAQVYIGADRLAKALPLLEETLKLRKAKQGLGPQHPYTLETMHNLAELYLRSNRLAEADPLARDCLAIREKKLPDDWQTFSTRSLLGGVLLGQKKYAEAEPLLVTGYEGMHDRTAKIPAYERQRLKDALQRQVQLYEATNQPEKSAASKAKLIEYDNAAIKEKPAVLKNDIPPTKKTEAAIEPNPSPAIRN